MQPNNELSSSLQNNQSQQNMIEILQTKPLVSNSQSNQLNSNNLLNQQVTKLLTENNQIQPYIQQSNHKNKLISDDDSDHSLDQLVYQDKIAKQIQQEPSAINVLNMIEQSQPIQKKNIKPDSLQHDIKLGWIPKTQVTGPIPISFNHTFLDAIIQQKIQEGKILYLGYRPTNTFQIHQKFYEQGKKYPFYQFHLCKSQFLERFFKKYYSGYQFTSDRKIGMIQQAQTEGETNLESLMSKKLIFDSDFQGGNLDAVYFEDNEFRLMIRVDSNTKGHCNYYNFKIKCHKTGIYRFRIMNMSKKKSLYERGMKPYIKITSQTSKSEDEWLQRDESVCSKVKFAPSPLNELLQDNGMFYSLKFQLELKNQTDYQLCYNIPYVYSELVQMISSIRQNKSLHVNKLGYTLSGVEIPIFTISQNEDKQEDEQTKKQENNNYFVVITGRIHPAESNGSHIVNGLIKFLLKDIPEVKRLRKNIVFKIVPMLNPDGVICGNTRTGFAGKDLNRKFSGKSEFIFPQVNNLRDYVTKMKQKHGKKLLFVIDIHGHSNRKGSFFFGPQYPILDQEYTKCRLLPKLYAARSQAFRYYSCKFKISSGKQTTSRGYFNGNGIRTYTHQTSIHSYYNFQQRKDLPFTKKTLQNLGKDLALAILDYIQKIRKLAVQHQKSPIKNVQKGQITQKQLLEDINNELKEQERDSDKMPSDKADSESDGDDIDDKDLNVFYQKINENREYFYEEILKNMKNKNEPSSPSKDKKIKLKDEQKEREKQKAKERQLRKEKQQKQKTKWNIKATYTPKKTLFDDYSKLSNVAINKNTIYRTTNSLIPKFKSSNSPEAISKRYSQDKSTQDFLMSFQRVKLQGSSNRIIYSVPNIKWDYSSQTTPIQSMSSNEIYRYDLNDYSHIQFQNKKDKNKQNKHIMNTQTIQKEEKQPKINRQLLQQLLRPSTNMLLNQQKINDSRLQPRKQQKQKVTSLINEKMLPVTDQRKNFAFSQMKRRESLIGEINKERLQAQLGPRIQTKKQEYLCKKWQKQIVLKTKRNYSLSNKMFYSDIKVIPIVNVGKNLKNQAAKTLQSDQKMINFNKEKSFSQSPNKKQILPKINLSKREVIVISNLDT